MNAAVAAFIGLLTVLAAAGWGWAVLTLVGRRPSGDCDRLLAYPLLGLLLAAFLGSVLWITGGFSVFAAVAFVGVGWILAYVGARDDGMESWQDLWEEARGGRAARWFWGVGVVLMLPVLLAPDTSWDSGSLHLAIAREAATQGSLPLVVDHPHLFNMFTAHTLLGWGYILTGGDSSVTGRVLLTFIAGLGLALATRRVARVFSPQIGLCALGMVLLTPIWLTQWGTAMVDLLVFATGAAGIMLCCAPGRDETRRWLTTGMICLAFAAASKHWGIVAALSLSPIWLWQAWRQRQFIGLRRVAALGCLCVLAASPWFLKNQWALGNAFAMDIQGESAESLAKHRLFPGESTPPEFYGAAAQRNLTFPLLVAQRLTSGYPWSSSLPPLLFCWWAFALFGSRHRWWYAAWGGAIVASVMYMLAVPSLESYSPARYFFNVAPWAYFLAAVGWCRWVGTSPGRQRLAWAVLLLISLPTVGLVTIRAVRKVPVVLGQQTELAYWQQRDPAAPLIENLNRGLGPEQRLFFVGERVHLLRLPRDQWVRTYQAHRAGVFSADSLAEAWQTWGITHVLVNDSDGERWDWGVQREWVEPESAALRGWKLVAENGGARLYRRPGLQGTPGSATGSYPAPSSSDSLQGRYLQPNNPLEPSPKTEPSDS